MRDDPALDRGGDAQLAHRRRIGLERVAGIERAGLHDIDVLPHVELIDRIVAVLEPDRGQRGLGHGDIGRPRRRHDLGALEVLERGRVVALADDELLHLVGLVLGVDRDVHGNARLLDIGVHALDRHQNSGHIDLVGDHRGDVGRAADQPHHLGLDVLFLEEAALERDEIRQRRADGEDSDPDLVLRRRRQREHRHCRKGRKEHGRSPRCIAVHGQLSLIWRMRAKRPRTRSSKPHPFVTRPHRRWRSPAPRRAVPGAWHRPRRTPPDRRWRSPPRRRPRPSSGDDGARRNRRA